MATERDFPQAKAEPTAAVSPEGAAVAGYEPPTLLLLGTLRDLTAVGSFPDPT